MYDIPEDCLLTYDPNYLDFHSDSTDFEDTQIQRVTNKNGNHSLITKTDKKTKHFIVNPLSFKSNLSSIRISKNSSKEMWESETIYTQDGRELGDRQSYVNKKCRIELESGDQIETLKPKRSLMRHKVIPCISSIFKRSNNGKRMSLIKETNQDDACQAFRVSYEPRMRQLDRRQQCYVTQPVHDPKKAHPTPQSKSPRRPSLTRKIQRCEYSNAIYSLTSSSEADRIELLKKKDKGWKLKKPIEPEVMKQYVDNSEKQTYVQDKQTRSSIRRRKLPFQVYANPCQYAYTNTGNSLKGTTDIGSTTSGVPSTCSGFWDYLFNKINNKYQNPKPEFFKPCDCRHSNIKLLSRTLKQCVPKTCAVHPCSVYPCSPNPCPPGTCTPEFCIPQPSSKTSVFDVKPEFQPPPPEPKLCACVSSQRPSIPTCPASKKSLSKKRTPPPPKSPRLAASPKVATPKQKKSPCSMPNCPSSPKPMKPKEKIDCACGVQPMQDTQSKDIVKPCQVPHACMANNVSQKYNGEILCIHNPPCVLINGCLNLPYPKPEPVVTTTMWPVVECNRASFHHMFRKKCPKNYVDQASQYQAVDQGCQYQPLEQSQHRLLEQSCQYQVMEQSCQYQVQSEQYDITDHSCQYYPEMINAYQLTDHRKEKMIQSSCNHKPPCEVKRICHRPKYDPKLQTSCVHVPMCDNLPLCVLDSSITDSGQMKRICRHKPQCTEVPICRKNFYLDLPKPACDEVGTQVRPRSKVICRHEPPCLMIPRCLDRLCAETCCQYGGAVPDCVHQPMCDLIPACCRKSTKEMVSVCSQHPNSCRIV